MISFGAYVLILRDELGLSQAGLAKRLGISASYLADLEHDRRKPNPGLCDRFADLDPVGIYAVRRHRWHKRGALAVGWKVIDPLRANP